MRLSDECFHRCRPTDGSPYRSFHWRAGSLAAKQSKAASKSLNLWPKSVRTSPIFIGYWGADSDGLAALPVEYAPGLFNVVTRNTARSARSVSQRFAARGLQLFKRTDRFPRTLAGASAPASVSPMDAAAA
jgi:hypothetical protein